MDGGFALGAAWERTASAPLPTRVAGDANDPAGRLATITRWIGGPAGRGRILAQQPLLGVSQVVRTWEADGTLSTRRIRPLRLLGAGLAGTVYLVRDNCGATYVEKHFGPVPASRARSLARMVITLLLALLRQAPLSFRELPSAVIAMHLVNRLVVAASTARWGAPITPPLLYTRYDARTGGYVQAFAFVDGRPLRPWQPGLPLLGEAAVLRAQMRQWRDFLADDLGLWGLARQVDPANVNASSNVWIGRDGRVVLLDIIPGLPGLLELRYLWWGLRRGNFPPFADAIDFERLAVRVASLPQSQQHGWRDDLELLRIAVSRWQASEPRVVSSLRRPLQLLTDPAVRGSTRAALLTHLEVKGAIGRSEASAYRRRFAACGDFPKRRRHSLLRMAPTPLHRAAVDARYARAALVRAWQSLPRLASSAAVVSWRALARIGRMLALLARMLRDRDLRVLRFRAQMDVWIAQERQLGRLSGERAESLRGRLDRDRETADLAGLFALHLMLTSVKQVLLGSSLMWLAVAVVTKSWWWLAPMAVTPLARVTTVVALGLGRHVGLLAMAALPTVGTAAAPLYLLNRHSELGAFILRALAQQAAMSVPAFGERGGLLEMAAVAAMQVFVAGPARVLPVLLVAAAATVVSGSAVPLALGLVVYLAAVGRTIAQQHGLRNDAAAVPPAVYGVPAA